MKSVRLIGGPKHKHVVEIEDKSNRTRVLKTDQQFYRDVKVDHAEYVPYSTVWYKDFGSKWSYPGDSFDSFLIEGAELRTLKFNIAADAFLEYGYELFNELLYRYSENTGKPLGQPIFRSLGIDRYTYTFNLVIVWPSEG